MYVLKRNIGSRLVELRTTLPELIQVVEHAFAVDLSRESEPPLAVITVRCSPSLPQHVQHSEHADSLVFHLTDGITYTYNPSRMTYCVNAGESIQGIIDIQRSTAEYTVAMPILPRTALHLLVLDPLSLLLIPHGILIYHAAALAAKGGASLLLGPSGSGKSTLGFLASHCDPAHDVQFMSDDTVVLDFSSGQACVYPINSGFGLSPGIIKRFDLQISEENVLQRSRGKIYVKSLSTQACKAQAAKQVVFLDKKVTSDRNTTVNWMNYGGTLRALLDSQTTIAGPYLKEKLRLNSLLAGQAKGVCLQYLEHCELETLRTVLNRC